MTTLDYQTFTDIYKPYQQAVRIRNRADVRGDAKLYRKAAAEFRALGMPLAAQRCDDKAKYCKECDGWQS